MNKLIKFLKRKIWWFDNNDDVLRYAEIIADRYTWELKNGDVKPLLSMCEDLAKNLVIDKLQGSVDKPVPG